MYVRREWKMKLELPASITSSSYLAACESVENAYEMSSPFQMIARTRHSVVYRGFSGTFNREVAIKIIDKRRIPKQLVNKFLARELEITLLVRHPHIVRTLRVERPNETKVVIISEYYHGGTLLQSVLKLGKMNEYVAARLFRQLAEAIHYLHDTLRVCHRDIKMENILIDKNNDLKLADFGFARFFDKAEPSTSYCGTKPYSAPQLVERKPYNAFAADWYASGVCLFTMLTGMWPHEPDEKCPFPLRFSRNISEQGQELILELMQPSESHRASYATVMESPWLSSRTSSKWIMANSLFVYEVC